jgi:hypothetical protein
MMSWPRRKPSPAAAAVLVPARELDPYRAGALWARLAGEWEMVLSHIEVDGVVGVRLDTRTVLLDADELVEVRPPSGNPAPGG